MAGPGYDTIILTRATAAIRIYLDAPNQNNNIATGQIFQSIEGIVGSAFSDNLVGNAANNRIDGMDGTTAWPGPAGTTASMAARATTPSWVAPAQTCWTGASDATGPAIAKHRPDCVQILPMPQATPAKLRATPTSTSRNWKAATPTTSWAAMHRQTRFTD